LTSDGIVFGQNVVRGKLSFSIIEDNGANAVNLVGTGISEIHLEDNHFHNNGEWGIKIQTGVTDTRVQRNFITGNTSGDIEDNGTSTDIQSFGLDSTQDQRLILLEKIARNKMITDPNTGILTIFDNDGVTPFLTGAIFEDVAAAQLYRGQGADRRERVT